MDKLDLWIFVVVAIGSERAEPPLGVGTVHRTVASCFTEGRPMQNYPKFAYTGTCMRVRDAMESYPDMRWL